MHWHKACALDMHIDNEWQYLEHVHKFNNESTNGSCINYSFSSVWMPITIMAQLTFSKVAFVDQTRDHMTVLKIIVVMGTKYICWYHTRKLASMLFIICPAMDAYIKWEGIDSNKCDPHRCKYLFWTSISRFACAYPKFEECGGPLCTCIDEVSKTPPRLSSPHNTIPSSLTTRHNIMGCITASHAHCPPCYLDNTTNPVRNNTFFLKQNKVYISCNGHWQYHCLIDWIGCLVREYAGGQAGDTLLDLQQHRGCELEGLHCIATVPYTRNNSATHNHWFGGSCAENRVACQTSQVTPTLWTHSPRSPACTSCFWTVPPPWLPDGQHELVDASQRWLLLLPCRWMGRGGATLCQTPIVVHVQAHRYTFTSIHTNLQEYDSKVHMHMYDLHTRVCLSHLTEIL